MTAIEDQARAIFLAALERAPDEWPAFLDDACRESDEARARVEQLLHAHLEMGSIHGGRGEAPLQTVDRPVAEQKGTALGQYKLIEQIGEGGMGTVWMAQQTEPVKRLVAVKLIKAGMDSKQVVARFEAERQALALMDHTNIARVLDAGMTGAGRPYFVMDLVKGVPITKYCDEHHLTPRQRLELFIPVCQAVQHAHQKGIIHRDLKPSNVLIALYDGKPVPKIIDFGVAKAAGQQLTDKTLVTGFGAIVGTLEYMSPEQAEINQLDIDTRSDVYSLGVLLYELLAGGPPFNHQELQKAGMLEMLRVIREQEPSKPSTKLSTSEGLPTLAANRGTEPAKLTKLMRGELDWIVMKALEKDRNRRYETANAFALDVERYLNDEQVVACPPSASYRLRKFVRRNRVGLGVSALVLFFLVLIGTGLGWAVRDRSAREADLAKETASRRARLNLEIEYALDDATKARDRALTLIEHPYQWEATLAEAASNLKRAKGLAAQDETALEPSIRERLESLRSTLNADEADRRFAMRFDEARLAQTEVNVQHSTFKEEVAFNTLKGAFQNHYRIEFAATPVEEAAVLVRQRPKPVKELLVAALEICLDHVPDDERQSGPWLSAVLDAADSSSWRKRAQQALQESDWKALEELVVEALAARQPPSMLLRLRRRISDPAVGLRISRRIRQAHPGDYWANHFLANYLHYRSPSLSEEAVRYYTAALSLRPHNPAACVDLGNALTGLGDLDGAISAYREALDGHPDYAAAHNRLAYALERQGDLDGAIAELRATISLRNYVPGNLVVILLNQMKWDEAVALLDCDLDLDTSSWNHERWYLSASLHAGTGDVEGYRRVCHAMLQRFGDTGNVQTAERTAKVCLLLADALSAADFQRVQKLADRAVTGTEKDGYYGFFAMAKGLADYRAGRSAEAIKWMKLAAPHADGVHWDTAKFAVLAMAHHSLGQVGEAAAALAKGQAILAKMPDPSKGQLFGAGNWHDWLHAQVLCREAEALLKTPPRETQP